MSKTTTYIVSNNTELENRNSEYKYTPGSSTFEIPFSDIDDGILKIENPSAANGAVVTQVSSNNTTKKIIVTPGSSVKTSGKSYNTVIKYNITYNQTDDKGNNITKVAYSKVIFSVTFQDNVGQCIMTAHNGKLRPDEYIGVHPEDNDLESLVTKKSLISNLKEFGSQVSSKIGSASALSINYNLNGGHWDAGFEPRYTFVNSTGYTAKAPKRLGYVFAGWNVYPASGTEGTEPAEADRLYSANATGAVIEVGTTQNITAYAQWTPIKYQVVFNNKDGEAIENQIFTYGSNATASSIAKPDAAAGYEFTNSYKIIGLNDQEVIYDVTKKLDRVYDLVKTDHETGTPTFTLTPIFAPKVYTINYDINDGVLETNNPSDTYTYGTSFVLPTPTRSGYSFNGWTATNTSNNFVQQRVISPSDLMNISGSTLNLKAVWTKNNYHFEFDTQGGILDNSSVIYIQPSKEYNITNPTREGYNFAGWEVDDTKADCVKGASATYKVTTKDDINTDIILKAKWTPVQVHVKVEYWYESLNATRNPSSPAIISNTIYSLDHTENLSLGTNNQEAITDSALTIEGKNNSWQIKGYTGINISAYKAITAPTGFSYVDGSISDNEKVNANGTTVIKLYFARNTAYYKINDKYDSQSNLDAADSVSDHIRGSYSCLYGQSITAHPIFDDNKPEAGYTVDKSAETKIITASSSSNADTFVFTYTRKTFTVKFDLNGVGTYQNSQLKGDIYTTTCRYGNTIALPAINSFAYIQNSSWFLNGTPITTTDNSITINGDSNIVRIPTLKNYTITLEGSSTDKWKYNGEELTADHNILNVTYDNFPYYLEQATKDGYIFSHWTYKTDLQNGNYHTLGGNTLSEDIIKTTGITKIYCKPEFVAEEPKITSVSVDVNNGSNNSLKLTVKTNSVTSHICFKATKANGTPVEGLGTCIGKTQNNIYSITDETVLNLAENSEILITPVYVAKNSNTITNTGKPWYGIIKKVGTGNYKNNLTVTAYPVYGVIGNDTDTTYKDVDVTKTESGLMTVADKKKLDGIKNDANKTTATTNAVSITAKGNDTTLDNTSAVSKTEVYDIGTVTPDATISAQKVTFKGKDTTYGKATNQKYGLVKLGDNEVLGPIRDVAKVYPVRATSGGNLGVYVPWTDNQNIPQAKLTVGGATAENTASTNPFINIVERRSRNASDETYTRINGVQLKGNGGTTITSDTDGSIIIQSEQVPDILNSNSTAESKVCVKAPSTDATKINVYLRGDGNWSKPDDTQVEFQGKAMGTKANRTYTSVGVTSGDPQVAVRSLIAGTNMTLISDALGNLTINGPETGVALTNGTGIAIGTDNSINLQQATNNTIGGVKVGDIVGSSGKLDNVTIGNSTSQTIYAPQANGKYYPIEIVGGTGYASGHAVVKIPDVPSPFYDDTADENKFTFAVEEAKTATWANMNLFTFTDDTDFNQKLEEYNSDKNDDDKLTANIITTKTNVYVTITCPTNVIFAQLDCPATIEGVLPMTVPVRSLKNDSGKQVINIKNDNVDTSFDGDSIKAGNPGYAYLRFTTAEHTYNAAIQITYANGTYKPNIII